MDKTRLEGKTAIVTGANTGIGKETAKELARRGARVILACRNAARAEAARSEIIQETKNDNVVVQILDLSSLKSVEKFAQDFNQDESRLDLLVNSAGVFMHERKETPEGWEMGFVTNYLGHFYLANLLLDKLKASAPSRIVNVSSKLHADSSLDFSDLQTVQGWTEWIAYSRSKTANVLFTVHLAKLLADTGVTTYCLHPGVVDTQLAKSFSGLMLIAYYLGRYFMKTPEQGAQTTLYCCLEPSVTNHSGRYYSDCREVEAAPHATDSETAERLWNISLQLCKL